MTSSWTAETADWYAQNFGEYATNRIAVDQLIKDSILNDNTKVVVDVGCGTGSALRHVASKLPNCQLIGVEPTPRMLEIAKERATNSLDLRAGGAEAIPSENTSVDVVLAFAVLDHVSDLHKAVKEFHRVLKKGGYLAIVKDGGIGEEDNMDEAVETAQGEGFLLKKKHDLKEGEVTLALVVLQKTQ